MPVPLISCTHTHTCTPSRLSECLQVMMSKKWKGRHPTAWRDQLLSLSANQEYRIAGYALTGTYHLLLILACSRLCNQMASIASYTWELYSSDCSAAGLPGKRMHTKTNHIRTSNAYGLSLLTPRAFVPLPIPTYSCKRLNASWISVCS